MSTEDALLAGTLRFDCTMLLRAFGTKCDPRAARSEPDSTEAPLLPLPGPTPGAARRPKPCVQPRERRRSMAGPLTGVHWCVCMCVSDQLCARVWVLRYLCQSSMPVAVPQHMPWCLHSLRVQCSS